MKVFNEKRNDQRHDHDAPVVYAYRDSDKFKHAKMRNFCREGMCFIAADALEPGSDIYVRLESFPTDAIGSELYDGYLAQVRWCRELKDPDDHGYKIGVKYYQTVIG